MLHVYANITHDPQKRFKVIAMGILHIIHHLFKGCQSPWFYGSNCFTCPDINWQYCHIETGYSQCCKPGYQGQRCELGKKSFQ